MFSTPSVLRGFSQENADVASRKPNAGNTNTLMVRKPFGDRAVNGKTPESIKKSVHKKDLKKETVMLKEDKSDNLEMNDVFYYKELQDDFLDIYPKRQADYAFTILKSYCHFDDRKTPEPFTVSDEDVTEISENCFFADDQNMYSLNSHLNHSLEDVSMPDIDFDDL